MLLVHKKERICKIIDLAVPGDSRIEEKDKDKIEKYQDLGRELQKIYWAVSLLRYSAAFVTWRKSGLQAIDRKTRKLFTIYGALHH